MADILTQFEEELDQQYMRKLEVLGHAGSTPNMEDVCYRQGQLQAIREMGEMIKHVRNPELPKETGEIPDILSGPPAEGQVNNA